jgi:ABC-2 type transport system permease protein
LAETVVNSSWMVALLAVPLFLAYGFAYRADPFFYLVAVGVMVPYLVLPAVVGVAVTLVLVNVFPARRTRDLLALIGLVGAAGIVALFRFLRPERLVRPEEFRDLVDFMAVLRTPSSVWLPNEWATDALMSYLHGGFDFFPFLLLLSTAGAFLVGGSWLHLRYYRPGYSRAQEGATRKEDRSRSRWLEGLLRPLAPTNRVLVAKEVRVFFRDSTQWAQLILLGVLVVVYVYNIRVLPLYTGEAVSFFLINVVSFLNLGLAGFVVAAIAARFVFPAMSLEGRMMWLLRSSPLEVRRLFWSKYWVGTVPLLLVAVPLIVATNLTLQVSPFVFFLTTLTMVMATFAMTAMALGFGALYPNYETDNVAEIPTSFGGLLFMMTAVAYLAGVIVLEAWPVHSYLSARVGGSSAWNFAVLPLVMGFAGATILTIMAIVLPLRAGVRKVRALDFQ